jgi:hypothetical protein
VVFFTSSRQMSGSAPNYETTTSFSVHSDSLLAQTSLHLTQFDANLGY